MQIYVRDPSSFSVVSNLKYYFKFYVCMSIRNSVHNSVHVSKKLLDVIRSKKKSFVVHFFPKTLSFFISWRRQKVPVHQVFSSYLRPTKPVWDSPYMTSDDFHPFLTPSSHHQMFYTETKLTWAMKEIWIEFRTRGSRSRIQLTNVLKQLIYLVCQPIALSLFWCLFHRNSH